MVTLPPTPWPHQGDEFIYPIALGTLLSTVVALPVVLIMYAGKLNYRPAIYSSGKCPFKAGFKYSVKLCNWNSRPNKLHTTGCCIAAYMFGYQGQHTDE